MSGELIHRAIEYASSRSRYSDVRFMEIRTNDLAYRNSQFEGMNFDVESGYAVRVVNNSIAMAYCDREDWGKIKDAIDTALKHSQRPGKHGIWEGKEIRDSWKVKQRKPVEDTSVEDRVALVKEYDRVMEQAGASVRVNVIQDKIIRQHFVNSVGSDIRGELARLFYFYMVGVVENGEFEQSTKEFGSSSGYEYLDSLNLDERIASDVRDLHESASASRPNPGKFDVIVGPEISGIVAHESCGHPTEYDRIVGREGALAGESFLTGKQFPYRIGSEKVSVVDDPSMEGSFGFYRYDDEGVPARKRYLYKNGYTNEFILNRESSSFLGTESNAGGRSSSWDMEPLARMSTTYVEPGDYRFEELFEGVRKGIYIKSFTEWNIDDIRFNEKYVGKEAYLISNGDITGRVRRPVIETNTIKFYSSVDAVGRDLEFSAGMCGKGDPEQGVDVWMGGPHMRLREVYIQ